MKLTLIGDSSVGKTALRNRFFGITFTSYYKMTIGAEFSMMDVSKEDKNSVKSTSKAQTWEIQPDERFKNVRSLYYIGTNIILLVYDISNPESFKNLSSWIEESQQHAGVLPVILIGNKVDLRSKNKNCVTNKMGLDFARKIKENYLENTFEVRFVETSALTGEIYPNKVDISLLLDDEIISISLFDSQTKA